MHLHVRVRRWVMWWFYVGIVCGAVAIGNILVRDFTRTQDHIILLIGLMHWAVGGAVCWALDGIYVQRASQTPKDSLKTPESGTEKEWHPPSDFVLPGNAKHVMPSKFYRRF